MTNSSVLLQQNSLAGTATLIGETGLKIVTAIHAINTTGATAFIQLFNAAVVADVTLGTTVPTWVVRSAASSVSDPHNLPADGLKFPLGVVAASTTTVNGSTGAAQHLRLGIK